MAHHSDPPGTAVRRSALRLLDAVLRRGEALEAALPNVVKGLDDRSDRALVHAITAEALRRLPDLDSLIDSATREPLPEDAKARMALRLALVQALSLKTPPHAAISTALPLVTGGPRRLVHGVFGTIVRSGAELPDPPHLLPEIAERWGEAWGAAMVEAARHAISAPPPIDLTLKNPAATEDMAERLHGVSLFPGHVRLSAGQSIERLSGYDEGEWWVQDIAASLPARLLGEGQGRRVLDIGAAPGGKTMQLAAAGWSVTALDKSAKRATRLEANLKRTGLTADIVIADALIWQPQEPYDAILIDAPCSATGIFRRHPDVLHRVGPRDIETLAELQAQMLDRALGWLKPGGQLVFATCSLEPLEGESHISARHSINPVKAIELPDGIKPSAKGWIRTLPTMLADKGGCDGFFMVRLGTG